MILKQELYAFCKAVISKRIQGIRKNISDIEESLFLETKSSAGDKHETGRAMLQLEREKLGRQLSEAEKTQEVLSKVPLEEKNDKVALGSLVVTNDARYYIAISAGEYHCKDTSFFCISTATPIGTLLLGKMVGDTISFRGKEAEVLEVL